MSPRSRIASPATFFSAVSFSGLPPGTARGGVQSSRHHPITPDTITLRRTRVPDGVPTAPRGSAAALVTTMECSVVPQLPDDSVRAGVKRLRRVASGGRTRFVRFARSSSATSRPAECRSVRCRSTAAVSETAKVFDMLLALPRHGRVKATACRSNERSRYRDRDVPSRCLLSRRPRLTRTPPGPAKSARAASASEPSRLALCYARWP